MQNFMKTIINAVQSWTKKEIKNSTADWNQNDPSAVDYVKNRTHWSDGLVEEVVLKQQTVGRSDTVDCEIIVGQTYEVTWDNKVYHCVAWGNSSVIGLGFGQFADVGEGETVPFLIYNNKIYCERSTTHTISITTTVENIHKLDSKYLDLPTNLATTDDVQEALDVANNAQSTANAKMNKTNPVGTGNFSMNRKSGTTLGTNSVALGYNTTASGNYSYAEGYETEALGNGSHAEGVVAIAYGQHSHVEGYHTKAQSKGQHAQGKFNILDTEGNYETYGKYAHIVGNGISDTARSNAHTLDWNGVGWFKGGLQVGGNAQDDGAKNVMLDGDAVKLEDIYYTTPYSSFATMTYGNGKFVAVSGSNYNKAFYSEDGINWTQGNFIDTAPTSARKIVYGNGKFVVIFSGSNIVAYSEDGINWSQSTLPANSNNMAITYGDGKFVVICYNKIIAYSNDGVNWVKIPTLSDIGGASPDITYGNGKFLAKSYPDKTISYSVDGITWTLVSTPSANHRQLTYYNGKFIIIYKTNIAYSEDCVNWQTSSLPISGLWTIHACGDDKIVVFSGDGTIICSEDGINWTQSSYTNVGSNLAYGNKKFITVFRNQIIFSEDGINWYNSYKSLTQNNENITNEVKDLILPISTTAQVGQLLSVKAVDENGKPTEWETVNPEANTSGLELVDRTTGAHYNVYVDNGKLTMEVV